MGDHFQTIIDLDAKADEAPQLGARVVEWLVTEGIVLAERTDCVLGAPLGHEPGPNWQRAVAAADADEDPWDGLAVHTERGIFDGGQGGPESVTCPLCETTTPLGEGAYEWDEADEDTADAPGDMSVDEGQDTADAPGDTSVDEGQDTADAPGDTAADNDAWPRFAAAMDTWHETGAATADCPACAQPVPLTDWIWADDYFAFGHLGLEFWNWPEFTPEFRAEISRVLGGHRTAFVRGKL
jgi:hypothetical protein